MERTYLVWVTPEISDEGISKVLNEGLVIEGKRIKPLRFKKIKREGQVFIYEITLKEGVRREIRKIVSYLGGKVKRLLRIAFGPIQLKDLKPGEIRPLTPKELEALLKIVSKNSISKDNPSE